MFATSRSMLLNKSTTKGELMASDYMREQVETPTTAASYATVEQTLDYRIERTFMTDSYKVCPWIRAIVELTKNRFDQVELFLNGSSLGTKFKTDSTFQLVWNVPFQRGTLKAIATKDGQKPLVKEITAAGEPAQIRLQADRSRIHADGTDLSFVTVTIHDINGNLHPAADNLIAFDISGEGFIAGVDNGHQTSHEPFKANYRKAYHGKCLAVVQTTGKPGEIVFKATSSGLLSDQIKIIAQ